MLIKALNNLDKSAQYSSLSSGITSGTAVLPIKNSDLFTANWAVQIGRTGEQQAEIVVGTAVSNGTIALSGTTKFDHPVDTPIYAVKFDQMVFKRSTAGTAGTASAIGTSSITPDGTVTAYDDTTGASTYAYKVNYRNSVTSEVSGDSDWLTSAGFLPYSLSSIRNRIKNKLYSTGYLKGNDGQINDWVNEWIEKMNNTAVEVNQDYSLGTAQVAFGTSGLGTIAQSDFKELRRIDITFDGSNWFKARKIHLTDWQPNEQFNSSNPLFYMQGDNVFGVKPGGTAGTASIYYYTLYTQLVNDTDNLPISMRGYSKSFIDYGLAQAYILDDKTEQGNTFMGLANMELEKFKMEITPRSKTGPEYITLTEVTNSDDNYIFI